MEGLITKETIAALRYVHGAFNLSVAIMAWFMLGLGLRVRRGRQAGSPAVGAIKLHRRVGPLLAALAPMGFLAGATLMVLDKGHVLEYPPHFVLGLFIALGLPGMYMLSRRILRGETGARHTHRRLGIALGVAYLMQVLLGVGILM